MDRAGHQPAPARGGDRQYRSRWGGKQVPGLETENFIRVIEQCATGCAANGNIPNLTYRSGNWSLRTVTGEDEARGVPFVEDLRITAKRDQLLEPLPEAGSYLGFIFARAPEPGRPKLPCATRTPISCSPSRPRSMSVRARRT